jgi:hypothetical protein
LRNCKIHYFAPTTEYIEPERKGAVLDKKSSWYLTAMYGVLPQIMGKACMMIVMTILTF